ncbi:MAG TPA: hypothetical protein VMY42_11610 [Thermoguttaceae bacterium]|nr:hypothetical protein [Thermoguttaceae bacterium]
MAGETVLRALRHVWLVLRSLNVPAAVVGGLGMAAWKHVRATQDIDLLITVGGDDVGWLLERLAKAGIRPQSDPPSVSLGQLEVTRLLYEPPETFLEIEIDLLIAKSEYYQRALQRRVAARLPDLDLEIAVLTCEDAILQKLLAGRIIDRADAAALLRANRESLDLVYISGWTDRLALAVDLAEIWNEAFPGEPLPTH